jgi:AcrR family transcriptional regulator
MTITRLPSPRRQAVHNHKRDAILAAARRIFAERGAEGTTMRNIAAAAGYVPGAVYAYFPTKQAILGELLLQTLGQLGRAIKGAGGNGVADSVARAAYAIHGFFLSNPREIDLMLHLLQGGQSTDIPADLDRQINGRLIALLQPIASAMQADEVFTRTEAERRTVALLVQIAGILLLELSGRLAVLGQTGASLLDAALSDLLNREQA